MTELDAQQLVTRAVKAVVGESSQPKVQLLGSDPRAGDRAQKFLRSGSRRYQINATGWGAAFEAANLLGYVQIQLQDDPDQMACDVARQIKPLAERQSFMRARAAAVGILSPLQRAEFIQTARLKIDLASAAALKSCLKTDVAVRIWAEAQFGAMFDRRMRNGRNLQPRLHGLTFAPPFLLDPLMLAADTPQQFDRPIWIGNQITLSTTNDLQAREIAEQVIRTAATTQLHRCAIVDVAPDPFMTASQVAKFPGLAPLSDANRWQVTFDTQLVSFDEAFG